MSGNRAVAFLSRLRVPLYVRLWLAVVVAVAVITVISGWLLRLNAPPPPMREVIIRDVNGDVVGQSVGRPSRVPGQGVEFPMVLADGTTLFVHFPPRPRAPGEGPPSRPLVRGIDIPWLLLALISLAVAIGAYPIVRRLTQRLENLSRSVQRWGEGDLAARVPESGSDEVGILARRFNQAAERVETLVTTHKSLLANASHELRSPLTRIRMGMELMSPPPEPVFRQEISRSIDELDQLIDEILLASRLDARETDFGTIEQIDLTGLAAEECARADAELTALSGTEPVIVPGVAKLLRRALRNLLENARRYSSGPVRVELWLEGGDAIVRVRDQGPGVPRSERERIFEPFYRLPGASERDGGVGLGLALVKSIALRHQGSITCEDQEGPGACFALRIPCHKM